jgi:amidase
VKDGLVSDTTLGAFRLGPTLLLPGAASGPLAGLTFAAKDLFDIAGHRTGAGNPTWLQEARPATATAEAVTRLVAAGASCVGKTHTDEFAFSLGGVNAHYGAPENPAAPGRTPGGSSSGSAAAVAGGLVDFALGTDTGGSVRVPASYCGLVGLRTSHGEISTARMVPLAPSFDTVGWFTRSARLARRIADVLLPPATPAHPERLALLSDALDVVDAPVADATVAAATGLAERVGLPLTTARLPEAGIDTWLTTFRTHQTYEAFAAHGAWVAAHPEAVAPDVAARFASGGRVDADTFRAAQQTRARLRAALSRWLIDTRTVLLLPSAAGPATPLDTPEADLAVVRTNTLRLTCIASITGAPGLGLPLAEVDGLPLGLCLLGAPGSDRALLDLAVHSSS